MRRVQGGQALIGVTAEVAVVTTGDKSKDVALRPDDVVLIPQTLF